MEKQPQQPHVCGCCGCLSTFIGTHQSCLWCSTVASPTSTCTSCAGRTRPDPGAPKRRPRRRCRWRGSGAAAHPGASRACAARPCRTQTAARRRLCSPPSAGRTAITASPVPKLRTLTSAADSPIRPSPSPPGPGPAAALGKTVCPKFSPTVPTFSTRQSYSASSRVCQQPDPEEASTRGTPGGPNVLRDAAMIGRVLLADAHTTNVPLASSAYWHSRRCTAELR